MSNVNGRQMYGGGSGGGLEFYVIEGKGWGGEGREGGWSRSQRHGESVSNVNGRQM